MRSSYFLIGEYYWGYSQVGPRYNVSNSTATAFSPPIAIMTDVRKDALANNDDTKSIQDLTNLVQNLLQQMQDNFQQTSDKIISRIDEMGNRIDDLEKNIADLMTQAGVDDGRT